MQISFVKSWGRILKLVGNIGWTLEVIFWSLLKPFFQNAVRKRPKPPFTIGITTFLNRYNNCFKSLISKISTLFPECQIIVVANGHVNIEKQKKYLISINKYCEQFHNVQIISFIEPKGLSYIWNRIIETSLYNEILILNDDLKIKMSFRGFMNKSDILLTDIAVINKSWSHFLINKGLYNTVGPFDEGLLEIGGEDDDYSARLAISDIVIKHFKTNAIAGKLTLKQKRLKLNSYGKNMNEERFGYSSFNSNYLESKWLMSNEPFYNAVEVPNRLMKYWKLKIFL